MKLPVKTKIGIIVFFFSFVLHADEKSEKEIPSLEFLEFLGSFATENGKWVDPVEVQEMLQATDSNDKPKEKTDD